MGYINVPGSSNVDIIKGEQLSADQITLKNFINSDARVVINDYIFINEDCSLILDNPTITIVDYTAGTKQLNAATSSLARGGTGRKIVRLSNGWIIAATSISATIYFYKSTDNGATWSNLTNIGVDSGLHGGHFAIASSGTRLYLVVAMPITKALIFRSYDALNPTVGTISVTPYSSITEVGTGVSLTVGPDGVLHAAWACKNGGYTNSLNVMYCKSTNADHSAWASATQITTYNTTSVNFYDPCVIVNAQNRPCIVYGVAGVSGTAGRDIMYSYYNGSSWGANAYGTNYLYNGPGNYYIHECVSLAMDSNGIIHAVWEGYTSGTAAKNILYATSSDGGATWGGATLLTSGNTRTKVNPSICINQNNDVIILFSGVTDTTPSYYQLHFIKKPNGGSWSAITVYTVRTTNTETQVSMIEKDTLNSDIPMAIFTGDNNYLSFFGKWSISNSPQIIKSVVNAVSANDFKAIGDGLLKSSGDIPKMYNGFISKTDLGFTTL